MTVLDDANWNFEPSNDQNVSESSDSGTFYDKIGGNSDNPSQRPALPFDILHHGRAALDGLRAAFAAAQENSDQDAIEALQLEAIALLREFRLIGRPNSPPQRTSDDHALSKIAAHAESSPPRQEPLWKKRDNYHETPAAFIEREYEASLLDGSLTREAIADHDMALYKAMYRPQHKAAVDALNIPTKKQVNDRLLAAGAPSLGQSWWQEVHRVREEADPETKERVRLYDVSRRRAKRASAMHLK